MSWVSQFAYGPRGREPFFTAQLGDQLIIDHRPLSIKPSKERFYRTEFLLGTLDDFHAAVRHIVEVDNAAASRSTHDSFRDCESYLRARSGGLIAEGYVSVFDGREQFLSIIYRQAKSTHSIATFLFQDGDASQIGPAAIAARSPGVFGVFARAFADRATQSRPAGGALRLPHNLADARQAQQQAPALSA